MVITKHLFPARLKNSQERVRSDLRSNERHKCTMTFKIEIHLNQHYKKVHQTVLKCYEIRILLKRVHMK